MEGRFHKHRSSFPAVEHSYEPASGLGSHRATQPSRFAGDLHQLLGDDLLPDALFFVESWTLSVPAAVENLQQRKRAEAQQPTNADEKLGGSARNSGSLGSAFFVQQTESANVGHIKCARHRTDVFHAAPDVEVEDQPHQSTDEATTNPMTPHRAWRILGVAATSTRAQIRSAYRRMVTLWHPDRLQSRSEEARRQANEQMAAINEAYRLLRDQQNAQHSI